MRFFIILSWWSLFAGALADSAVAAPVEPIEKLLLVAVHDSGAQPMTRGYHHPGYSQSPAAVIAMADIGRDYSLKRIDSWPIRVLDMYCAVMAVATGADRDRVLVELQHDRRVNLAQPLQTFDVHTSETSAHYNDPYFSVQYGKDAKRVELWHQHATGRGVRIAIVDTGLDRQHPELRHHVTLTRNFVDGDDAFDRDMHGTAVAGIIAAEANNGVGIVGIAPDAEVLALKACWQLRTDFIAARCNSFSLAKALSFAIEQRVDIINLSLGGPDDPLLTQLLQLALARGTLVVAAKNNGDEFPANMPGVVAVVATVGGDLAMRDFIRQGTVVQADASELLSTSPGGHYDFFSGSSMAAARVTGLSALMRQGQRQLTAVQMLENLQLWLADPPAVAQSH